MSKLLESFVCLISRFKDTPDGSDAYTTVSQEYRPVLHSSNETKKLDLCSKIESSVIVVYQENRDDVLNKDFSFLKKGVLVILDIDIGNLYRNTLQSGDDSTLKKVTSELLYLFHCVMDDKDKEVVESKFKKPKKSKFKKSAGALDMQSILAKNKDELKSMENDPSKMTDVMGNILKNNNQDFVNIAKNMLKGAGLDPEKMVKKSKKK